MRTALLVAGLALAAASPAWAQVQDSAQVRALLQTRQLMAADSACLAPANSGAVQGDSGLRRSCGAISAFVQNPDSAAGQRAALAALRTTSRTFPPPQTATLAPGAALGTQAVASPGAGVGIPTALTDFLITRAWQEMVQAFFADVAKDLAKDPKVSALFPSTLKLLTRLDTVGYRALLPAIRASFNSDLQSLPKHIAGKAFFPDSTPVWAQAAAAFSDPFIAIVQGGSPMAALGSLARVDAAQVPDANLLATLHCIGSLASKRDREARSARQAAADPRADAVYGALVNCDQGRSLASTPDVSAKLTDLADVINRESAAATRDESASQRAETVLNSIVRVLREAAHGKDSADVVKAADLADALAHALANHDWSALAASVLALVPDNGSWTRLVTLGAALASAKSGQEVSDALTAAADPVGSFRARRQGHKLSFAIVAYAGAQYGWENLPDLGTPAGTRGSELGVALPLGLELAHDADIWFVHSIGLFVNVLDLGTLASYRLSHLKLSVDTVETVPNASLADVFAPGASVMLGLSRQLPLSVGFGVEYVPSLRSGTSSGRLSAVRFSFIAGLDLTLFRF